MDRGSFSVECINALFACLVMDKSCMYMNRGNHESKNMNQLYGFMGRLRVNMILKLLICILEYLEVFHWHI